MSTADILARLERMSNDERLAVIEAATQLIRRQLAIEAKTAPSLEDDPILKVAGTLPGASIRPEEIDRELYGTGLGFILQPG